MIGKGPNHSDEGGNKNSNLRKSIGFYQRNVFIRCRFSGKRSGRFGKEKEGRMLDIKSGY